MRKIILVLLGLFLVGGFYAREKKQPQDISEKAEVILEVDIEKQFEEPVIDVIYDEAEMTVKEAKKWKIKDTKKIMGMNDNEKIKVRYPKVIVTKAPWSTPRIPRPKNIQFFNSKAKLVGKYDLREGIPGVRGHDRVVFSKNKQYICVIKRNVDQTAQSIILNTDGQVLWEIKHNLSAVIPSPNGEYIVGAPTEEWGDAPVYVYNREGLIVEIKKDTMSWDVDFSDDGELFSVSVERKGVGSLLILFDKYGNKIWERKYGIRKEVRGKIHMSNNRIHIATSEFKRDGARKLIAIEYKEYIFDMDGNIVEIKDNAKEVYARILYKKYGRRLSGISEDFYRKLQNEDK